MFGEAKPFLKWAGGKSQLLPQISPHLPRQFNTYGEPFMGSAALYFHLCYRQKRGETDWPLSRLSDMNAELVNCYQVVRDRLQELVALLTLHRQHHSRDYYYSIRNWQPEELDPVERAARLIYLNKTCYNGLYRVNRAGKFNVPIGRYRNPRIFDAAQLQAVSLALQNVVLEVAEFSHVLGWAKAGDLIYLDPPYVPRSPTANFTGYTHQEFDMQAQVRLAKVYRQLDQRGCYVILSNSWSETVLDLYRGFRCLELKATRMINSKADQRGYVSEVLVLNY
ncbi:MAG: DNA adenine methylase [Gloeomargarita sp. DG02_3_bins_56]